MSLLPSARYRRIFSGAGSVTRKWRRHARKNRTGMVPPRRVIWRWAMQWREFHRSCKFYHTKRPPPHPYYTQKMERNQPQRSEGWKQLPTVMPLTKRLPLESRGAHEARALCAKQREVSPVGTELRRRQWREQAKRKSNEGERGGAAGGCNSRR